MRTLIVFEVGIIIVIVTVDCYFCCQVAEQTGCHGDLLEDDLAPCLRNKPLAELLAVRLDPPRFLPGFAPFVDGTVIVNPSSVSLSFKYDNNY